MKNYDKRIFRFVWILNKLSNGNAVTTAELSVEFNVSNRTVQRDIKLLSEAGFPIISDGVGNHFFMDGFSLKKALLTHEEASLIAAMYEMSSSLGDTFKASFNEIYHKILASDFNTPYYVKLQSCVHDKENIIIKTVEKAIESNKKIVVKYKSKDGIKEYGLSPLKLVFYDGFWYVLAFSVSKQIFKKFRLDYIKSAKLLTEQFTPPENIKALLDESINIWFSSTDKLIDVKLKISIESASYFKERKYFPYQKSIKENKDGSLIILTKVSCFQEILPTLKKWIPHIIVISPKKLKTEILNLTKEYIKINS